MTPTLTLGSAASLGLCILALAAFLVWSYKAGERIGYGKGYDEGRVVADNWWMRAESEADEARVKIWREEAER